MVNTVDYISRAVRDEYEGANVARICEKMMRNSETSKPVRGHERFIIKSSAHIIFFTIS